MKWGAMRAELGVSAGWGITNNWTRTETLYFEKTCLGETIICLFIKHLGMMCGWLLPCKRASHKIKTPNVNTLSLWMQNTENSLQDKFHKCLKKKKSRSECHLLGLLLGKVPYGKVGSQKGHKSVGKMLKVIQVQRIIWMDYRFTALCNICRGRCVREGERKNKR